MSAPSGTFCPATDCSTVRTNLALTNTLFICGASSRAAAFSALRARISCATADLFADQDLAERVSAQRVSYYPAGLVTAAAAQPPGRWMYTGALENHPQVVERISLRHRLLGNGPETLRRVRDPWQLAARLPAHQIRYPEVRRDPPDAEPDSWLVKPFHSAGGSGIRAWSQAAAAGESAPRSAGSPPPCYWQRKLPGAPHSASYVADANQTDLLGVSRQLIGAEWTGATGYQYAGSLGPIKLPANSMQRLADWGEALRTEFGLLGLFGVDFLLDGDRPTLIEINPRYTASMEVLERAGGWSAVARHLAACESSAEIPAASPMPMTPPTPTNGLLGKAILFARHRLEITPELAATFAERLRRDQHEPLGPSLADVPVVGVRIEPGQPVLTVFAHGNDIDQTFAQLRAQSARMERLIQQ